MKGHEALIAMRRAGWKPALVHLDTADHWQHFWRDWSERMPAHAQVYVESADVIERLDLRFLLDLPVVVQGEDAARVGRLAQAALRAKASRVIAGCGRYVDRDNYITERMAFTPEEIAAWPL